MKFSFKRKLITSFFIVTAAFAVMLYAFYHSTKKLKATTQKVNEVQEAVRVSQQILTLSLEIGFGSREYILTGNEKFLEPFKLAVDDIHLHIIGLRYLTANNPVQQQRIDTLEALTKERVAFAEKTIAVRKYKGMDEAVALINTGEGRRITEATRSLIESISAEELHLLEKEEIQSEASMSAFEKVLIGLIIFVDVILILVGAMVFQKQEIRNKYEAQLRKSNSELESFSYMVSHDLRSPVKTLLGLLGVAKKKYEPHFEPELKELFGHMENKTHRMNDIIEDLLTLARCGREKIQPASTDMNALFAKVWSNVRQSMPNRAILKLPLLPPAFADASMLEQVLINLCSNAVKYSSYKENPLVEIGFTTEKGANTFFVKDNGAGFDMKDYNRLFQAFQRLHHSSEFEGTGVGLLLVKRIIEMHNGKIWAESRPNEGATFYFSLPSQ